MMMIRVKHQLRRRTRTIRLQRLVKMIVRVSITDGSWRQEEVCVGGVGAGEEHVGEGEAETESETQSEHETLAESDLTWVWRI